MPILIIPSTCSCSVAFSISPGFKVIPYCYPTQQITTTKKPQEQQVTFHINHYRLIRYHNQGIVGGIPGCSPFLHHISHRVAPYLAVSIAFYKYQSLVPFFFAFFSKLSNRLINSFSFLSCSWFIIYSSKQNLHTSLCDNLPSLILPFFGWFTIQSLYVATITLAYYHLKTLRYLFLMWFSLGLIEYRLLQHGHLFLYGPVPCLNGIHSMHVLQYP